MAGKHHKRSRIQSTVARVAVPGGLAAAAVTATSLSTAFVTGTTPAVAPAVELMALVTPANSTSQFFAGTTYYGTNYEVQYGPQQVVPFLLGPQGIANAISDANDGSAPGSDRTDVLASGWGAGQTGSALKILANNDDPDDLKDIDLVILDNNTNRAAGGFWTTYDVFAPLLFTSAEPTPSNLPIPVLDVGYAYNINGSAATDPLNLFALGNSLAAYVYGYGAEQTAVIPDEIVDEAKNPAGPHYHYVLNSEGETVGTPTLLPGSTTTYVTFSSEDLPVLRPLRLFPGGDILADALEPTMTELVDAGYEGGEPIPTDPRVPRPMRPFSSFENLDGVPGSVQDGLDDGAETAQDDFADPSKIVTKPIEEFRKLPLISSLPNSTVSTTNLTTKRKTVLSEAPKTGISSSIGSERPRPLKRLADKLKKLAGGEQKDEPADEND